MSETPITTWHIDENAVEWATEKLGKINTRAAKHGLAGRYTWTLGKVTREPHWHGGIREGQPEYYVSRRELHVHGEAPKLAGWSFLAVLTWDDGVLVTRTVPGFDGVIDRATLVAGQCDHCHKARRRRDCYLLENETGRRVQVGSACIKDFLGYNFTPGMLTKVSDLDDIEDAARGMHTTPTAPALDVLAYAAAISAEAGWVSRDRADVEYRRPSAEILRKCLFPYSAKDGELATEFAPTEAHCAEAATVLAWVTSLEPAGSEYLANLVAIATAAPDEFDGQVWVSERNVGMLGSAVASYHREMAKQVEREARPVSQHVGQAGQRLTIKATVKGDTTIDGDWGVSHLYTLADGDGNVFKWFSSRNMEFEVGAEVRIKGTVKKHEVYKDVAQTMLTRCALAA